MNCGTEMTNALDSIAIWRIVAIQPSGSYLVGATQSCTPFSYSS